MAPRPGIINLDFKDTTQIGKNIHGNDPLGNLLATGIDVLGDRERDILYRRALAQAQVLEAPDETSVGDLVTGAGKKIGEGASWLKDKWDRLDIRSPFEEKLSESTKTETPITETPSEKGSREMIGYVPNQSPIETDKYRTNLKAPEMADVEPNDEVSFGFNADVGQGEEKASPIIPFATGEQTPEQIGVKVDFGTSEPETDYTKLRSPFAMRAKSEGSEAVAPEKAQESTSPFGNTEVAETKIKAPRMSEMEAWSEMYRLKPEQAKFDYTRTKEKEQAERELRTQVYTPKQKSIIDAKQQNRIRMGEIQGTINTLKTETERKPWLAQLRELQARDIELNNQLAELGTAGYAAMGQGVSKPDPQEGGTELIPISATTNAEKYQAFTAKYKPEKYKSASEVPTPSQIMTDASLDGYALSQESADKIYTDVTGVVKERTEETITKAEEARKAAEEARNRRREIDASLESKFPSIRDDIKLANDMLAIIPEGDSGIGSARNEAVKKLSRKASNEALAGSDFVQALGRSGILSTLTSWSKVNVNITDAEWNTLKTRILSAVESVKSRRATAVADIPGADARLEKLRFPSGGSTGGSNPGSNTRNPPPTGRRATDADF